MSTQSNNENKSVEIKMDSPSGRLEYAMQNKEVPKLYINSFAIGQGPADIFLALELNGEAKAGINISYNTAKSLLNELNKVINNLESQTGTILSIDEVANKTTHNI